MNQITLIILILSLHHLATTAQETLSPHTATTQDTTTINTHTTLEPTDTITAEALLQTGQATLDKALQHLLPSFSTAHIPMYHKNSLLDPYDNRNMGASRTLVLINGKRKNPSALMYIQDMPGRGEVGVDLSAISIYAVERIEILQDGAAARYGSDAIAGVMNIVLKSQTQEEQLRVNAGIVPAGADGEHYGLAFNQGKKIGEMGWVNYTLDLSKIGLSNRRISSIDISQEGADFLVSEAEVGDFWNDRPENLKLSATPETWAAKAALYSNLELSKNINLYVQGAYTLKKVKTFADYRPPYWRSSTFSPYLADFFPNGPNGEYIGYQPTFESTMNDYQGGIGLKVNKNGWLADLSFTVGGNQQDYFVNNSVNRSFIENPDGSFKYRENSPTEFYVGGTNFYQYIANLDISKKLNDKWHLLAGGEFKQDNFSSLIGNLASYEGSGTDSYFGTDSLNIGQFRRSNLGGYLGTTLHITPNLFINGTFRLDNYEDFGIVSAWKVLTNYRLLQDKITLRAAISSNFKAPSLHQIYTQRILLYRGPATVVIFNGLLNQVAPEVAAMGFSPLFAEQAMNMTVGIKMQASPTLSWSVDYYHIEIEDRIILSSEFGNNSFTPHSVEDILLASGLGSVQLFTNALDTRTVGLNFNSHYKGITLGKSKLGIQLQANYILRNEQIAGLKLPPLVEATEQDLLKETHDALLLTAFPKFKAILGLDYTLGKLGISINNTLFGTSQFKPQLVNEPIYVKFHPKIVTNLAVNYQLFKKLVATLHVNNFFYVLPEWSYQAENEEGKIFLENRAAVQLQTNRQTFNGRYAQPFQTAHFSQLGMLLNLALNWKF